MQGDHSPGWLGGVVVVLVAVAASSLGLFNEFAQDDVAMVLNHTRLHPPVDMRAIFTEPYWPEPFPRNLYRPFTLLTLAGQWALGDGAPMVFRVVSYLLYGACALGVLLLSRTLLPGPAAFAVAALFAAHPVHVEAVALGVNQGELWVGLLAVVGVRHYIEVRRSGWPRWRDWCGLGGIYLAACLFKEHAVALPGLLVATELTVLSGSHFQERLKRLWPGFVSLALTGVVFLGLRTMVLNDFVGSFAAEAIQGQGIGGRSLTMLQVVPEWLRLLSWPARLRGDYSPSIINQANDWGAAQTLGLGIILGVGWIAWVLRHHAPSVPFGVLWFGVTIFPVSNLLLPTGIAMAERTLFLPSVGFMVAAGGLALHLLRPSRRTRILMIAVTSALVIAGAAKSGSRHRDWRNHSYYWWRTATVDAPLSYRAHHALARQIWDRGFRAAAVEGFHTAMALYPPAWWVKNDLANRFRLAGECYPALELYAESLAIQPDQPWAYASRIACFLHLGHYQLAKSEAETAIKIGTEAERFEEYRATADSALRVGAAPGTVRIRSGTEPER